jgi:hypothetical protein
MSFHIQLRVNLAVRFCSNILFLFYYIFNNLFIKIMSTYVNFLIFFCHGVSKKKTCYMAPDRQIN